MIWATMLSAMASGDDPGIEMPPFVIEGQRGSSKSSVKEIEERGPMGRWAEIGRRLRYTGHLLWRSAVTPMLGTPQRLGIIFIGHSSFLVQAAGQNLLYGSVSDRRSIRSMHRQSPQMESKTGGETPVTPEDASSDVVRLVLFASILIAAATLITLMAVARSLSVFDIPDLQGLQVKNWVTGRGFGFDGALFTGSDNQIWMRCARMPLPIWTLAGLRIVFGSGMIAVNVAKSVLWSLPLILSFALIQRDCRRCLSSRAKWAAWGALLFVSLLPVVLVNLATMSAEEGYIASPIALATTMLLFPRSWMSGARNGRVIFPGLLFGVLIASIYLSKSSMIVVAVIMVTALWVVSRNVVSRNLRLTVFAAIPLLLAMLCWGAWTAADGGRISFGTSLDGYNLHKGNNPTFLEHYPPPFNMNIDPFYADIGVGHHYKSESDFDAGQEQEALKYIKTHPRTTIVAMGRKIGVLLFSLKKVGPGTIRSPMVEWTERASRVIAQLILWTALLVAGWQCVRWKPSSLTAAVFLVVTAAICLPYVVGFALSRHGSILYLPAIIYITRSVYAGQGDEERSPMRTEQVESISSY